jgi:hypothetical protein
MWGRHSAHCGELYFQLNNSVVTRLNTDEKKRVFNEVIFHAVFIVLNAAKTKWKIASEN